MTKDKLRQDLLQQRQALEVNVWQEYSLQICQQLQTLEWFQQAQTVLAYYTHRQEPDLRYLFQHSSKTWGLPRTAGRHLAWHHCHPLQDQQHLERDRYGILSPAATLPKIDPKTVDLILVPCVAVDQWCSRLGYGGGFYDRLLAQPQWHGIRTVGIVFEFACVSQLPTQAWDIPLQGYCTEVKTVLRF